MTGQFDLVVACHLRWSFVWQRPQQLLSRLARHRRVLFIEEPVYHDDASDLPQFERVAENIMVLSPRIARPDREATPIWADRESISAQVRYALNRLDFKKRGLWFYTPLPEFLVDVVKPDVLIYDVMDELANFKFAPPQIKEQEARILRRADVVFTGGASLYESKLPHNPNTHLFASGVDAKHYSRACDHETDVPAYVRDIPAPRATYIGVIDERMDYEIIAAMAARRPDVSFLMVGPVVKVDPNSLPKAPNLHYLGQRDYADLPCILKGSDVTLMPFALNDATKFISPTKTLEYMATHRPIVSTPIRDVERFYSNIVYLAQNAEEFVAQINIGLNESVAERERRRRAEERILAEHAWDAIAENMNTLMEQSYSLRQRLSDQARLYPAARSLKARPAMKPTIAGAAAQSAKEVQTLADAA